MSEYKSTLERFEDYKNTKLQACPYCGKKHKEGLSSCFDPFK